ncbi:Crp/Fnr family transcriptional regulator [Falsibacillus pallidus]|uniref:Crp/Fnr family transcriptional regulator n=1 Tax=Falsibacillus pallidus TaxID=493781 RepID=UPI003D99142F
MEKQNNVQKAPYSNTGFFSAKTMELLQLKMKKKIFKKDAYLFLEHDKSNELFFVIDGEVKITKSTEDGKELVLYTLHNGDLFGELGLEGETKHRFQSKTAADSVIGVIPSYDMEQIIIHNGEAALELIKWMARMNQFIHSKLRDLMLYGKNGALCSTLIRLSHSYGKIVPEGILIDKKMKNNELAEMIGTSRETINRMLNGLKKIEVVEYCGTGEIIILDMEYLKLQCRCEGCPIDICRI